MSGDCFPSYLFYFYDAIKIFVRNAPTQTFSFFFYFFTIWLYSKRNTRISQKKKKWKYYIYYPAMEKKPPAVWRYNKRQKQYKYFINRNDCSRITQLGNRNENRKHFHNPLDLGKYHLTARICLMAYFSPSYLTDPSNGNHYLLSFFLFLFIFTTLTTFLSKALIFFLLLLSLSAFVLLPSKTDRISLQTRRVLL